MPLLGPGDTFPSLGLPQVGYAGHLPEMTARSRQPTLF